MAIPGITYRLIKESPLTQLELDNNFRSVIYSSSIHNDGDTLRLHFDTSAGDYYSIPLSGGSRDVSVDGNIDNRVLTATGTPGLIQGESSLTFDGTTSLLSLTGSFSINDGDNNIVIGSSAGGSTSPGQNTVVGILAAANLTGQSNTALGYQALDNATTSANSVALGHSALGILANGSNNLGIGYQAGITLTSGTGNIYLGASAGPSTDTAQSNKLYINNTASDTPLILGDFSTGQVTFNSQVSASIFSGSFYGDGTNLTGLTVTQGWDGTFSGSAAFTGSLVVSGSTSADVIDFTQVSAISGSIFSGSFVGDGSGLTGVQADTFPYTGSAIISGSLSVEGPTTITGSFTVSGSSPIITLKGDTFIDQNIHIHNKIHASYYTIGIGYCSLANSQPESWYTTAIGGFAGCSTTGGYNVLVGTYAGQNAERCATAVGYQALKSGTGTRNTAIGFKTLSGDGSGQANTAVGALALSQVTNANQNTGVGNLALYNLKTGTNNVGIGAYALGFGNSNDSANTAIGTYSGCNAKGFRNVFVGYSAGPSGSTVVNDKLYINNNCSNTPLIYGDFSTGQLTIYSQVSASVFSGSFYGDGSNLTGITATVFPYNGDAVITGSLTVSGSSENVNFLGAEGGVSGSFSGSFVGDGSGLTGVTSEWDGSRDGNAEITGSLIVSGAIDAAGTITIASQGYPGSPGVELIHFFSSSLAGTHNIHTFAINSSTGYTGIKVDYSLSNSIESEKKIGTLLGGWDQSGNSTINDSYTIPVGAINSTSFSIDASSTTEAILKLNASAGTYDVNMLITAFKRQV